MRKTVRKRKIIGHTFTAQFVQFEEDDDDADEDEDAEEDIACIYKQNQQKNYLINELKLYVFYCLKYEMCCLLLLFLPFN